MYYTVQPHYEQLFRKTVRTHTFNAASPDEFLKWRSDLRQTLKKLTGINSMVLSPLNPQVIEETSCDGYTRIKMLIQTEPDVLMPFYLLKPNNMKSGEKRRAVIASHGHCGGGKDAVAGVRDSQAVASAIEELNYNYGEILAQKGYMVFCPDARGFGERRERYLQGTEDWKITGSSCSHLNSMAIPLGQTVTGMWVWDLMRLVDYVQTREDVTQGVASVGLSGGGLQSLWLTAMDDRVKCCVISGYFYGFQESLLSHQCCSCNYVPDLWKTVDIGDIGAMIAPRPLVIETGDEDELNGESGLANVIGQVDTVRKAMNLMDVPDHLYHDIFHGGHRWHGDVAYAMLEKYYPVKG